MCLRGAAFEFDVPQIHFGLGKTGRREQTDPGGLVQGSAAAQRLRAAEKSGDDALLRTQSRDLGIELKQLLFEERGAGGRVGGE